MSTRVECSVDDELRIIRGESKDVEISLSVDGRRFDVAEPGTVSTIEVRFAKADGTTLALTLAGATVVLDSAPNGELTAKISAASSALLKVGARQRLTVKIVYTNAEVRMFNSRDNLTVEEPAVAAP